MFVKVKEAQLNARSGEEAWVELVGGILSIRKHTPSGEDGCVEWDEERRCGETTTLECRFPADSEEGRAGPTTWKLCERRELIVSVSNCV